MILREPYFGKAKEKVCCPLQGAAKEALQEGPFDPLHRERI